MTLEERVAKLESENAQIRRELALAVRTPAPARLTRLQAAATLGLGLTKFDEYVARGLLQPIRPGGVRGRGKRVFFHPANVAALAQSEEAAREWVARRKFVTHANRKEPSR